MTTKPAAAVNPAGAETLERLAYDSVAGVETAEPNDRNRLGYHVWRWLQSKQGTLEDAIRESGSRLSVAPAEAARLIREHLASKGVS